MSTNIHTCMCVCVHTHTRTYAPSRASRVNLLKITTSGNYVRMPIIIFLMDSMDKIVNVKRSENSLLSPFLNWFACVCMILPDTGSLYVGCEMYCLCSVCGLGFYRISSSFLLLFLSSLFLSTSSFSYFLFFLFSSPSSSLLSSLFSLFSSFRYYYHHYSLSSSLLRFYYITNRITEGHPHRQRWLSTQDDRLA